MGRLRVAGGKKGAGDGDEGDEGRREEGSGARLRDGDRVRGRELRDVLAAEGESEGRGRSVGGRVRVTGWRWARRELGRMGLREVMVAWASCGW